MPQVKITDESARLLHELWQGLHTEHNDQRSEADLVDDAIFRVHCGFYGLAPGDKRGPDAPTGPFKKWASDRWAEVLLRQIDPTKFELSQPFRYDDGTDTFNVDDKNVTDLASVPRFLTWLSRGTDGTHSPRLVHDNLQHVAGVLSEKADVIFRDAMGETGVPLAEALADVVGGRATTEWHRGALDKVRVAVWAAIFGLAAMFLWPTAWLVVAYNLDWDGAEFVPLVHRLRDRSTDRAVTHPVGTEMAHRRACPASG